MREKGALIHLDDICEEFNILLVDTSALIRPLDDGIRGAKLIDRIKSKKTEGDSSIFFNKYLEKGSFFLTKEVFEEYCGEETPPIREVLSKYDHLKISKKEREYFKNVCSVRKEKIKLLNSFKKKKKIICLDNSEEEKYNEMFKRNLYLKERTYKEKKKIGDVDYNLLIIGAVLSMTRTKTAVLSNDFPLLYSYQALLTNEHLNPTNYGFFLRIKQDFFCRGKSFFDS